MKIPKIYLDTVIIRKLIEKRPAILLNLMRTIKERKWVCFSSTLGILELSDLKKDDVYLRHKVKEKEEYKEIIKTRDQKKLNSDDLKAVKEYISHFLSKYPFFSAYQAPKEIWGDALTITLNSNIHSVDAVHLAVALGFKADILVTSDTHFITEANNLLNKYGYNKKIKVVSPEKVFDALSELGFNLEK